MNKEIVNNLQRDLLNAKQRSDTWPTERLSYLRTYLDTSWETIHTQHQDGASGSTIVAALTQRVDTLIQALYAEAVEEHGEPTGFAVIAQGGYGRGALNPHSDIDLLFSLQEKSPMKRPHNARDSPHPVGTLRFDVGYGTRTLSDCIIAAQDERRFHDCKCSKRAISR